MASQTDNVLNGWDLEAFQETVATVERNPDAGRVTWRGRVSWDGHLGLDAHADAIEQLGEVIPRRFTMRGDHPPAFRELHPSLNLASDLAGQALAVEQR